MKSDRAASHSKRVISERALSAHQQRPRLLDGGARVGLDLFVRGAADRMADDRKPVVRHAEHAAHELGGADEACRHHPQRGHSLPLGRDCVVQTAR